MIKILIIAGEVSGDSHGAALIRVLKSKMTDVHLFGIGGDELAACGVNLLHHNREMAYLGVGEVIRHLPFILQVQKEIVEHALQEKTDCAILIDYPGFNLRIARDLKKHNIKVIYYISPQLWAWGKRRIKKIRRDITKMIVLFPFEKTFYHKYGIEADYVGHPLVDKHAAHIPEISKKVDLSNIILGLLPGSRKQEVVTLLPRMLESARQLQSQGKIHVAEIVKVRDLSRELYTQYLKASDKFIKLIEQPLAECLPKYDAAIVASGTATLETAYFGVPQLIVYHVNALTYWLGRLLIKLNYIGLANIVAEREVAPELIQHDFTPDRATQLISDMLIPKMNWQIRQDLMIIREKLGEPGASERAANIIKDFLISVKR